MGDTLLLTKALAADGTGKHGGKGNLPLHTAEIEELLEVIDAFVRGRITGAAFVKTLDVPPKPGKGSGNITARANVLLLSALRRLYSEGYELRDMPARPE